ncbi:MAG: protein-export chaperone SecB [Clostridia bacterium]|nr:protein-export chaperone SecB [Clostridia bacterium]
MSSIVLKGYRAKDIEFRGHLSPGEKVQLDNKYSYNVRYGKDQICVAELSCQVFDKNDPEHKKFFISVVVEGIFSYPSDLTREQIHVLSYKELFPYARVLASTITSCAGIPPIILPAADIENQSIYRIDTGNIKP